MTCVAFCYVSHRDCALPIRTAVFQVLFCDPETRLRAVPAKANPKQAFLNCLANSDSFETVLFTFNPFSIHRLSYIMAAPSEDISAVAPTRASGEKVAETVGPVSHLFFLFFSPD